jgi:hypothetical protein
VVVNKKTVIRQLGQVLPDIDRSRNIDAGDRLSTCLMQVVSSTAISGYDHRWIYTVRDAVVTIGSNTFTASTGGMGSDTHSAISVSELSNGASGSAGAFSYGVSKTSVPAGFAAVPIPDNSYVICVPHVGSDGFVWLIINTQAIDGSC